VKERIGRVATWQEMERDLREYWGFVVDKEVNLGILL
jgi:hypothetical protein